MHHETLDGDSDFGEVGLLGVGVVVVYGVVDVGY